MEYSKNEVYALIEELENHDDVLGHCSYRYISASVCKEDSGNPYPPMED